MKNGDIAKIIGENFQTIFAEHVEGKPCPELSSDLVLLESGLDSLGFAILVTQLEDELGYDPFTLDEDAYYPQTLGDFVSFYMKHKP